MARVKTGTKRRRRHKKILKSAKGHYGRRKNTIRIGRQSVEAAGEYAYMHRKSKKRDFRSLWITRINAAARMHGLTYSEFMHGIKQSGIQMDRKVLADIAFHDAEGFAVIAKQVQGALKKA